MRFYIKKRKKNALYIHAWKREATECWIEYRRITSPAF